MSIKSCAQVSFIKLTLWRTFIVYNNNYFADNQPHKSFNPVAQKLDGRTPDCTDCTLKDALSAMIFRFITVPVEKTILNIFTPL